MSDPDVVKGIWSPDQIPFIGASDREMFLQLASFDDVDRDGCQGEHGKVP